MFFLRTASGRISGAGRVSYKGLLFPLGVILAAPVIDFLILQFFDVGVRELALITGVGVSLFLATYLSKLGAWDLGRVARKMKPWNFGLIIFGMFLFLAVFKGSGVSDLIVSLNLPLIVLCVGIGFLLGLVTGRIQVPASIVIPIYLGSTGVAAMSPWPFAMTYISIFLGYVISPVHPCISVSLEYFRVPLKDFLWKIITPAGIVLLVVAIVAIFVF